MGKINVTIIDSTGSKEQTVTMPDDAPVRRIITKVVEALKLPVSDPSGSLMSYKFIHKRSGKQLIDDQTLSSIGVQEGDVLRLQAEITAGV